MFKFIMIGCMTMAIVNLVKYAKLGNIFNLEVSLWFVLTVICFEILKLKMRK